MPTVPRYVQTERPQGYQNVQPVAGGAEAMGRAMRGLGDALGGVGRDMWGIAIAERDKFDKAILQEKQTAYEDVMLTAQQRESERKGKNALTDDQGNQGVFDSITRIHKETAESCMQGLNERQKAMLGDYFDKRGRAFSAWGHDYEQREKGVYEKGQADAYQQSQILRALNNPGELQAAMGNYAQSVLEFNRSRGIDDEATKLQIQGGWDKYAETAAAKMLAEGNVDGIADMMSQHGQDFSPAMRTKLQATLEKGITDSVINAYAAGENQRGKDICDKWLNGGPVNSSGLNAGIAAQTAQWGNGKVKYFKDNTGKSVRDPRNGRIDCSGWVGWTLEQNGIKGFRGLNAEGQIDEAWSRNARPVSQEEILSNPRENMLIAIDTGPHDWDRGRKKGIDHIVVTYRDPQSGQLMVSESAGGKGVQGIPWEKWLSERGKKTIAFYGADLSTMQVKGGGSAGGKRAYSDLTLSEANNNPGNINGKGGVGNGYAAYGTTLEGFQALDRLIQTKYRDMTPLDLAKKYAPENDPRGQNDPVAYARQMAKDLGIGMNDKVDVTKPEVRNKLMRTITQFEGHSGKHFNLDEIDYVTGAKQMPEGYQSKDLRKESKDPTGSMVQSGVSSWLSPTAVDKIKSLRDQGDGVQQGQQLGGKVNSGEIPASQAMEQINAITNPKAREAARSQFYQELRVKELADKEIVKQSTEKASTFISGVQDTMETDPAKGVQDLWNEMRRAENEVLARPNDKAAKEYAGFISKAYSSLNTGLSKQTNPADWNALSVAIQTGQITDRKQLEQDKRFPLMANNDKNGLFKVLDNVQKVDAKQLKEAFVEIFGKDPSDPQIEDKDEKKRLQSVWKEIQNDAYTWAKETNLGQNRDAYRNFVKKYARDYYTPRMFFDDSYAPGETSGAKDRKDLLPVATKDEQAYADSWFNSFAMNKGKVFEKEADAWLRRNAIIGEKSNANPKTVAKGIFLKSQIEASTMNAAGAKPAMPEWLQSKNAQWTPFDKTYKCAGWSWYEGGKKEFEPYVYQKKGI